MPIVLAALRRPLTVIVLMVAIVTGAWLALRRAPVDIFPALGVPVIYVVQPYAGMTPSQMEGQLVNYYEYHFLYIAGIEHVESQSIQGMGVVKLYFHPGTDIAQAMAQVTAMAFRATSFMPAGTLPPFMVRFDAGSIPVGQLVFASDTRSEAEVQDAALNQVRPLLATLPGVSAPPPSGGKVRTIVGYLTPERLRAYGLSPDDVALAIARANVVMPAGNVRVGDSSLIAETNAMVIRPSDLERVPIRMRDGTPIYLSDVGRIADDADIVYNVALVDGRRTVYMPVTKRADASSLDVVRAVKDALPRMRAALPDDVRLSLEFDQSTYVTRAIASLIEEGALGALLTGLVVLVFLRSLRSALIVTVTIPISILAACAALRLAGQSVNVMTLSGLALAVGILVDEATVAIENIHTHLAGATAKASAIVDAMREVTTPRFLAMLCILAVFLPAFFMVGVSASLFPPLALAVGFAIIASYAVSSAVVPVLAAWWLPAAHARDDRFARIVDRYSSVVRAIVHRRGVTLAIYGVCLVPLVLLATRIGTELFPRVDAGQMQLRVRAPPGTRLEKTVELVRRVDAIIREEAGADNVAITLANIGNPAWTYPVNAVYVFNAGSHEATLLVSLRDAGHVSTAELEARLRPRFARDLSELNITFEAGDVVSRVMSFGSTTPIQLSVTGKGLAVVRRYAESARDALAAEPLLRDVQIPIALDTPTMHVDIDRERAAMLGLDAQSIARSFLTATSSTILTTPLFWTDAATGTPYRVALRVAEREMQSVDDVLALGVGGSADTPVSLAQVASVYPTTTPGEIDRFNNQRTIPISATIAGRDLGAAAKAVRRALRNLPPPPRGIVVAVHGQVEQMETTIASLRDGLVITVIVITLLLVAAFQSVRDALVVVVTIPAVLGGVAIALTITGTTWNIQSLMGAVMAIGVALANSVLLISFARERRHEGVSREDAALAAATARLRPILMTSLAMIAGMLPMALAIGGAGEQSAPLGCAVIGGLVSATVATLTVLPAAYATLSQKRATAVSLLDGVAEVTP